MSYSVPKTTLIDYEDNFNQFPYFASQLQVGDDSFKRL